MKPLLTLIKESSIVVTVLSVIFYFWGYAFQSFHAHTLGIPIEFMPNKSIQDFMLLGGMAGLTLIAPVLAIIFVLCRVIDHKTKGKVTALINMIRHQGTIVVTLVCIFLFSTTVAIIQPFANYIATTAQSANVVVKSLTLTTNTINANNYIGLFFISKKSPNYVFADTLSKQIRHLYLLRESEVKEIVFAVGN